MTEGTLRRLTTIVAVDIAGFSRLIGIDEEATLSAQRGHRTELIEPLLAEHHGRIANTAGDSFLLEFPSAVEAVRCTIAIQDGITDRNRDIAADQRIEYVMLEAEGKADIQMCRPRRQLVEPSTIKI